MFLTTQSLDFGPCWIWCTMTINSCSTSGNETFSALLDSPLTQRFKKNLYSTSFNKQLILVLSMDGLVMTIISLSFALDDNFRALNYLIKSILFFCFQFFLQFHFRLTPNQIQQQQQKRGGASQQSLPPGLAPPPPRNIPSANPLNPFAQRWVLYEMYTSHRTFSSQCINSFKPQYLKTSSWLISLHVPKELGERRTLNRIPFGDHFIFS